MSPGGWGSQACQRTLSLQCGGVSGWYDSAINPDSNFQTVRLKGTSEQWSFICWRWDRLTRESVKQRKLSFLLCQIRPPLPSVPPDGSGVFSIRLSVLLNPFLFLRKAVMYPRQTSNCHGGKNDLGLLTLLSSPARAKITGVRSYTLFTGCWKSSTGPRAARPALATEPHPQPLNSCFCPTALPLCLGS